MQTQNTLTAKTKFTSRWGRNNESFFLTENRFHESSPVACYVCPISETKLFIVYVEMKSFDRQMTGIVCTIRAAVCNIIKNPSKTKDNESSCWTLLQVMSLCFYTNSW